jgi:hypothetical protein
MFILQGVYVWYGFCSSIYQNISGISEREAVSRVCMMTVTMLVEAKVVIPRLDRGIQAF